MTHTYKDRGHRETEDTHRETERGYMHNTQTHREKERIHIMTHTQRQRETERKQRQREDRTLRYTIRAIIIGTLATLLFVGGIAYQRQHDTVANRVYEVQAIVIYTDKEETIYKDINGDEWSTYDNEGYNPGDKVIITLTTEGTAKVNDDIIKEVRECR